MSSQPLPPLPTQESLKFPLASIHPPSELSPTGAIKEFSSPGPKAPLMVGGGPLSQANSYLGTLPPLTNPSGNPLGGCSPGSPLFDTWQQNNSRLRSLLDVTRLPSLEEPQADVPLPASPPRLPLFSRCPLTDKGQLWKLQSQESWLAPGRAPLLPLPSGVRDQARAVPGLSVRRPWPTNINNTPSLSKPSLDNILCTSLVALTNKQREGKYWFKSGCPTPDPRWAADQQLMIGPIPGDIEYSELRTAFLAHGQTSHLFIQNNQAWLERNHEKFGPRQVKFGYVVYSDAEVAGRLCSQGSVLVRRLHGHQSQVNVKRMDGYPALFNRN